MKCNVFDNQVADWLGGRLSENEAQQMAAHKSMCSRCQKTASIEADLRRRWNSLPEFQDARIERRGEVRSGVGSDTPSVWPKVAERISIPTPRPRRVFTLQWATAGALAFVIPFCLFGRMSTPPSSRTMSLPTAPKQMPIEQVSAQPIDMSLLADSSQGDPDIDDPAGISMEHVWISVSQGTKQQDAH